MPIKIKNKEWIEFRRVAIKMLIALTEEYEKIIIPESFEHFELYVDECEIHPVFTKKPDCLKIEYDFSLCDIELRLLSLYMYANVLRMDFSLKNENKEIANTCQENRF